MAKVSFIAKDVTPLSQNNRRSATVTALGNALMAAHNAKYPADNWPRHTTNYETGDLQVRVYYLHKVPDRKDADNISKPLWDSLNEKSYEDDNQIKYLETLKVGTTDGHDLNTFDLTDIEDADFDDLVEFLLDPANTTDRLLYIAIDDFSTNTVRF